MSHEMVHIQAQDNAVIEHEQFYSDLQVIQMWLHGRAENTREGYEHEARRFLAFIQKSLKDATLQDMQDFADSLNHLAPSSQSRALAAIRSLFKFAREAGYLPVDVARLLRLPRYENRIAERILEKHEVRAMIDNEPNHRNRVILMLLYYGALRLAELSGLKWRNLQPTKEGGQVTVFGKGGKTRSVALPAQVYREIMALKPNGASYDDPVFSADYCRGGTSTLNIKPRRVEYMVRYAAKRAGIDKPVSPHWLRHSHATHALDAGALIHVVMNTLGHASLATTEVYLHVRPGMSSSTYLSFDGE